MNNHQNNEISNWKIETNTKNHDGDHYEDLNKNDEKTCRNL